MGSALSLYSVILIVVFILTFAAVAGVGIWLSNNSSPLQRRLRELEQSPEEMHVPGDVAHEGAFTVRWLEPVGELILPKENWRQSRLRSKLIQAGFRRDGTLKIFLAAKIILAILVPALMVLPVVVYSLFSPSQLVAVTWLVSSAFIGFLIPDVYLARKAKLRQRHLTEVFPDAMDLLVVCVEAGLSLDAAIQRVSKEVEHISRDMSDELRLVTLEMRAGKDRNASLKSLAERTGMPEMLSLVSILVQADHFGTSVASALREHASEMREVRIQKAREKAARLPVLMTFPIALFIFPALFLVILGPALVKIFAGYIGALG